VIALAVLRRVLPVRVEPGADCFSPPDHVGVPGYGLLLLKLMQYTELRWANELFPLPEDAMKLLPEGIWNMEAGGYRGLDYFLFYYGMHQTRLKYFNLPDGQFQIDVIDTWNMTIVPAAEHAQGKIKVELPARKFMAIRIQRVL
jgi:hypothetical protein